MGRKFTLAAVPEVLSSLGDRAAMLREFRNGTRTDVTFPATVYIHGPNRNHVNLNTDELEQFAASFVNTPFLRDHSTHQQDRGGTVTESKLTEKDGKKVINQTIRAVKDWAVEGYCDGTVDRFSIGWNANEYICTVCKSDIFACKHGPFKVGSRDTESGKMVEVLMKGIEGMETSAVTHPAVPGTGVDEVLAQLCLYATSNNAGGNDVGGQQMLARVIALLGLPADTTEQGACDALATRLAAPMVPKAMLTALELADTATVDDAIGRVMVITAPGAFVSRDTHEGVCKELKTFKAKEAVALAKHSGKITPAMEAWAIQKATEDLAAFQAYITAAPVQVPTAASGVVMPNIPAPGPVKNRLSDETRERIIRLGITEDEYLAEQAAENVA